LNENAKRSSSHISSKQRSLREGQRGRESDRELQLVGAEQRQSNKQRQRARERRPAGKLVALLVLPPEQG